MVQLQRILWILGLCALLILPVLYSHRQNQYYLKTWEKANTELFFHEICRKGYCTSEDYQRFHEKMTRICVRETVAFEEYQRGFGVTGTEYRLYVSWDEINAEIESKGMYVFLYGSELRMQVGENVYFGLVKGGK